MSGQSNICMVDKQGRRVGVPLIKMQSEAGLREIMKISPHRTADCWAEMQERNARVRHAMQIVGSKKKSTGGSVRRIKIEEAR